MKQIFNLLLISLLLSVGSCKSKYEHVNQLQNMTDRVITYQYITTHSGHTMPIIPGQKRIFRLKYSDYPSFESDGCPLDLGGEEFIRIYDGDDTINLEDIIDNMHCEYSEEDLEGIRNRTRFVCTCFYE